jgi:hypothetical protein
MKFKILHIPAFLFLIACSLNGQSKSSNQRIDTLKNQVYLEIFGNGLRYSVNYERLLTNWTKLNIASRVGFGYYPFNNETLSVPVEITTFWGGERDFVESGFGLILCKREVDYGHGKGIPSPDTKKSAGINTQKDQILVSFRLGYRYQKPNGRSSFRFGLTILYESYKGVFQPTCLQIPIGFSYGYRF